MTTWSQVFRDTALQQAREDAAAEASRARIQALIERLRAATSKRSG